jgi:histidinol-phosphate aminotransferase
VLRQEISNFYNIDPSWVLCGNGSEDTLHLLARTYATEGDEIIFAESAFGLYQIATLAVGAKPVVVPRENFKLSPEAILQKITPQTKIIYLDHPGNPVGNFLHKDDLLKLVQKIPSTVLIVLDAAYAEYLEGVEGYTSGIELVSEFSNVVMARTFSKAYALAGLRLGWIYANPTILDPVNRIRPPFNVTSLTQSAGIEALKDQAWVKKAMDHNAVWRPWFEREIEKLGLSFIPCYANFSMVNFGDKVSDVYQFLGKNGIIVRPMGAYNLPTYLRITIGQPHEMEELVSLLNKFYIQSI